MTDMSLNYLSFYKKIDQTQAFGASLRYFDLGEIILRNFNAEFEGVENPSELAFDGTYSRKLTENMGLGVTLRFIWSNLAGNITGATEAKAGTSVAVDFGWYYTKPLLLSGKDSELSLGAHISNIGQKVTYSTESSENFIPANLRVGGAFKTNLDAYNTITFALDINKLLVPTPPRYLTDDNGQIVTDANGNNIIAQGKDPNRSLLSGTFGSFGDAPQGFFRRTGRTNLLCWSRILVQGCLCCANRIFFLSMQTRETGNTLQWVPASDTRFLE